MPSILLIEDGIATSQIFIQNFVKHNFHSRASRPGSARFPRSKKSAFSFRVLIFLWTTSVSSFVLDFLVGGGEHWLKKRYISIYSIVIVDRGQCEGRTLLSIACKRRRHSHPVLLMNATVAPYFVVVIRLISFARETSPENILDHSANYTQKI